MRMILSLIASCAVAGAVHGQLGPCATPLGPALPDLTVSRQLVRATQTVTNLTLPEGDCQVVEGCVNAAGDRRVLRFSTLTPNIGDTPLVIGDPSQCDLLFDFSPCHGHYHFRQYSDYRLWTRGGYRKWRKWRLKDQPVNSLDNAAILESLQATGELYAGRKQGFCLFDSLRVKGNASSLFDNCSTNQGINVGWADLYDLDLDCQYMDVTDAPPGVYILEVEVNPEWILPEKSYRNNAVRTRLRLR